MRARRSEEQQLQQILNETFTNTGYVDQDIGQFINDPTGAYQQIFGNNQKIQRRQNLFNQASPTNRQRKSSSRKLSGEGSQQGQLYQKSFGDNEIYPEKHKNSLYSDKSDNEHFSDKISRKTSQQQIQIQNQNQANQNNNELPASFKKLDNYYKRHRAAHTLPQVKQNYNYFVISNPTCNLTKAYEQNIFQYNTLKNVNIQVIDIGFCTIADNFKVAVGTDDGRVALFEKTYIKPVNIFQAFSLKKQKNIQNQSKKISITSIKWSQNLQYLGVASSTKQLKVYQFKQSITIQDKNILRLLKQPLQLISLSVKQLKKSIISIKFVSQNPFMAILNDQDDDMQLLQYKLHIINYRPYLSKLQIKFNDVFQVETIDFIFGGKYKDLNRKFNPNFDHFVGMQANIQKNSRKMYKQEQYGTLIAVSSDQYVTIALFKPYFQVIMVYDKQKHGKNITKQGYAHISFRKQPLGILIVWDKFAQLLNIDIQSLNPLRSRISSAGMQLLPETTLLAGLMTDTLAYQMSQSGIKIYATACFGDQKSCTYYKPYIYQHPINFFQLPLGLQIQQQLIEKPPNLTVLRLLSSFVKCCNDWLFITSNTSLFSIRIQKFQQLIRNTIQSSNNWKIGLQLLHDGYLGKYTNYDNMTKQIITKNIHQYTTKYINFLQIVIGNSGNQQNSNQLQLWLQQATFLFNILIETQQFDHLFNKIIPKLANSNLGKYISSLQPFILLHKLPQISPSGLQLLYDNLMNKDIISTLLIGNINPQKNEIDLPHMLNQIMLHHKMYEELVAVNLSFKDYFTPFVVMVSHYEAIHSDKLKNKQKNDIQIFKQLKLRGSDTDRSNKSQKNQQNSNSQQIQQIQQVSKKRDKQRLQQIIVYLTYKVIHKINTNQDCSTYQTPSQHKIHLQKHKQFLQIFLPLFQTSIVHILLDSPQQQFSLFQYILPELFTGQCLRLINDISNKKFNTDLMTDLALGIPISRVRNLKNYWICIIGLYNRSVIKMDVFTGLRYLVTIQKKQLQQYNEIKDKKQQIKDGRKMKHSKNLNNKQPDRRIQYFIKQTIHLSLQKINQQFKKLSPQILQSFYNELLSPTLSFQSSHIGLLSVISIILGQGFFIKVIQAMMVEDSEHKVKKKNNKKNVKQVQDFNIYTIYGYINETIGRFCESQKDQLKRILYQNIQFFIQLSHEKLCDFILQHYLSSIDKFISYNTGKQKLNMFPGSTNYSSDSTYTNSQAILVNEYLLIKLIQGLLNRLNYVEIQNMKMDKFQPNSQWMLGLRLKYLRLLAITGRQHEILSQLKKQNYPIDQSLQICRRYGIIDAQAYLLVRSGGQGEIASAIKLYFTLISDKIKFLTPETMPDFRDYFISIVRQCIRVCQNLHDAPDYFNEEWFLISQQLYNMKTNIYRVLAAYTGDLLCDVIQIGIYPILTQKIVQKQNSSAIVQYLKQNMENLDIIFIRALLHQIIKNFLYQKSMILLTQESFISAELSERNKIFIEAQKGFVTEGVCQICYQQNGILIHYSSCGHQIHPSCGQDVKICYICSYRVQKMLDRQLDIIRKIRPELYSKQNELQMLVDYQQKQKQKKQTKLQKLYIFDGNKIDIDYYL